MTYGKATLDYKVILNDFEQPRDEDYQPCTNIVTRYTRGTKTLTGNHYGTHQRHRHWCSQSDAILQTQGDCAQQDPRTCGLPLSTGSASRRQLDDTLTGHHQCPPPQWRLHTVITRYGRHTLSYAGGIAGDPHWGYGSRLYLTLTRSCRGYPPQIMRSLIGGC